MNQHELALLDDWLSDTSFINWAKNTSLEDVQQWESYLEQHPQYVELAEIGRFAIINLSPKPLNIDPEHSQAALKRLKSQLKKRADIKQQTQKYSLYQKWQLAAAILLLIGLSTWLYTFTRAAAYEVLLSTNFGETKSFVLEDDSSVMLNANSTLKYYSNQPRQVWLEGEAFFEIAKKPKTGKNFRVFTKDLTVNVLGTHFNVNSRNNQTKVFLEEGRVALEVEDKKEQTIDMKPGELVSYSKKQNKVLENRLSKAIENTSWKEGIIRFKEASLEDALREITAIYGIPFEINNADIQGSLFSGGVPINDLPITLETLEQVYGLEIKQVGDRYIVSNS